MSLLVRKISRGKWPKEKDLEKIDIQQLKADMLADLRTSSDKLSVWEISDETEVDNVILALSTGAKVNSISTTNVVLIDETELNSANLVLETNEEEGDTAIDELKKYHRNIINLDVHALLTVVNLIIDALKENRVARLTEKNIKDKLKVAIENDKVNTEYLSLKLKFSLTGEQPVLSCPNCSKEIILPII